MDLTYILATKIKPELNHIYTERPFLTRSGWDLGWFCRENALHLYGLAVLAQVTTYFADQVTRSIILLVIGMTMHGVASTVPPR